LSLSLSFLDTFMLRIVFREEIFEGSE